MLDSILHVFPLLLSPIALKFLNSPERGHVNYQRNFALYLRFAKTVLPKNYLTQGDNCVQK